MEVMKKRKGLAKWLVGQMKQQEFDDENLTCDGETGKQKYSISNLMLGMILAFVGADVVRLIVDVMCSSGTRTGKLAGIIFMTVFIGVLCVIPFFVVAEKWLLKLFCLGGSCAAFLKYGIVVLRDSKDMDSGAFLLWGRLLVFLGIVVMILMLLAFLACAIRPSFIKGGIVTDCISVVVAVGVLIVVFGGRGYVRTVDKSIDALVEADVEGFLGLIPDKVIDRALKEGGYSRAEFKRTVAGEYISGSIDKKWKVTCEIRNAETLKGAELLDLKEMYEEEGINVVSAKNVAVKLLLKDGKTVGEGYMVVPVIKVGRSWYLDIANFSTDVDFS